MLTNYIAAAMRRAIYRPLEEGGFVGEIPGLDGIWANADSLNETREDLRQALEGWLVLGLRLGHPIPQLDGIDLNFVAAD